MAPVVTEEVQTKITYTQDWAAYNAAQCAEHDLFPPLLHSLCSTPSRPYSGKGRPRLPLSDMVFDCVSKVYSGLSARRFDGEVREAKEQGMTETDPSLNTVLRHLRDPELTPHLEALVRLSATPLAAVETTFALDATGFSTCTYVRWFDHKWGKEKKVHQYVKLHAMTGVKTNIVTDARVTDSKVHDSKQFVPLLDGTAENFDVQTVCADKGRSTKAIAQAVADAGATPFIPFREIPTGRLFNPTMATPPANAPAWDRMYHLFAAVAQCVVVGDPDFVPSTCPVTPNNSCRSPLSFAAPVSTTISRKNPSYRMTGKGLLNRPCATSRARGILTIAGEMSTK
jgi:hypothetical protein